MFDRSLLIGVVALAAVSFGAPSARANDGEFNGTGATAYPVESAAIALDEEDLTIRQTGAAVGDYIDAWSVKVVYRFRNTKDAPVTVQMGFPERCYRGPEDIDAPDDVCRKPTIFDFTAAVDGKSVKTTVKTPKGGVTEVLKDVVFQRVHTFSVTFGPGQTRQVVHTYRLEPSILSPFTSVMEYILQTGGLWVGNIRRLDITIAVWDRFEAIAVQSDGTPPPKVSEKDGWTLHTWHHEDVQPTWDLEVHYSHPVGLERAEAVSNGCALLDEELRELSAAQLRQARNLVYAAYGYAFKKADMQAHFAKLPWYRVHPDYTPKWISKIDMQCIQRIKAFEKRAGSR